MRNLNIVMLLLFEQSYKAFQRCNVIFDKTFGTKTTAFYEN